MVSNDSMSDNLAERATREQGNDNMARAGPQWRMTAAVTTGSVKFLLLDIGRSPPLGRLPLVHEVLVRHVSTSHQARICSN